MDINRNNYEAFLLDLLEGRLSVNEQKKLNDFMKNHPEYVADLPDIDLLSLEKPQFTYPLRDQLKKEFPTKDSRISADNFDLFSIARMEGDLSPQQEEEHRYLVDADDNRLEEWSAWQNTRLVPEHISFPEKKKLRRNKSLTGRVIWLSVLTAAASLTLILVLLRMDPNVTGPELSAAGLEESLPAQEQPLVVPETPVTADVIPLTDAEETPVTADETPVTADEEIPGAVREKEPLPAEQDEAAIAVKNPELEIKKESLAELSGSSHQIIPDPIEPRSLSIASQLSSNAELAAASPDHIKSLPLPQVSPNLSSLSVAQLAELDRRKLINEFTEEHDISLMSVANAGIKGINKLTGSEISLLASRDDEGEISGFRLKSKRFSFSKPLAREQ